MICRKVTHHYTESGLDNVHVEGVEVYECPSCDERIVSIPAVPRLNTLIGKFLIEKNAMLTGREIRFLRKNAGLSAKRFARLIGVDSSTVSRWENDNKQKPTPSHDRFIRLLYSGIKGLPKEETQRLISEGFEHIEADQKLISLNIPLEKWTEPATSV
jgi:putative zinc finger/helix-turn-helix YgiT family protein